LFAGALAGRRPVDERPDLDDQAAQRALTGPYQDGRDRRQVLTEAQQSEAEDSHQAASQQTAADGRFPQM